jgi:hypothetical protein
MGAGLSIDDFDDFILEKIIEFLWFMDQLPLRVVCRRLRTIIEGILPGESAEGLLAMGADYNSEYLCETAKKLGAHNFEKMASIAAQNGSLDVLKLAIKWGSDDYIPVLRIAAIDGYSEICSYLGQTYPLVCTPDELLVAGAFGRNMSLCLAAKDMGATDWNYMCSGAAREGHLDFCLLAKEWGATNFNPMLGSAAFGNHKELCLLAKQWGAFETYTMLIYATKGNNIELCKLAISWRRFEGTHFDHMLAAAAANGYDSLCYLAKSLGATDYDNMLLRAIKHDQPKLCCLAKYWGAFSDADKTLKLAVRRGRIEVCKLARQWGATDFSCMIEGCCKNKYDEAEIMKLRAIWQAEDEQPPAKRFKSS